MRTFAVLILASLVAFGAASTELGEINGAQFRIDMPENWNGSLVVYCHGYSPVPGKYKEEPPNGLLKEFLGRGYAVAQSGYSAGGWAIQEAVVDTESVRRHFVSKHGKPKETWITGHSMGGFLTMTLMEMFPTVYDGGLPLCGPLAAPLSFISRGAFDGRVVFDYFFPGLLSSPANVTETDGKELTAKITAALDAEPAKAETLRRINRHKSNKDLASVLSFVTLLLKELQVRAGGNPFDNTSFVYTGSADDYAFNDGVKRYAADPKAEAYLRSFYTPTGKISRPMLAIHTVYDPLVSASIPNMYLGTTAEAGTSNLFVQQYVKRDGHCTMTPGEIAHGFDELRDWVKTGKRPTGGDRTIATTPSGSR